MSCSFMGWSRVKRLRKKGPLFSLSFRGRYKVNACPVSLHSHLQESQPKDKSTVRVEFAGGGRWKLSQGCIS